ncbi:hypothetical protein NQ318_019932 [Aromia moschata]|uniref:Uncharacterized protein n=1 Tax=Aromia moschata TaxID=1265417 RepID=A0AAV8Y7S1_9CUCU|nr:hypothetical protein NQ318_019932 [Aromia moschata]
MPKNGDISENLPAYWTSSLLKHICQCSPKIGLTGRNEAPSAPDVRKFLRKVRETGMLMDNRSHPRACPVRTAERIAAVAQSVRENPRTSTRHRAQQLNISHTSLRRILHKDLGLFAYKLHLTQERDEKGWKMNHMIVVIEPPSRKRTSVQYVSFWRETVVIHLKKLLDQLNMSRPSHANIYTGCLIKNAASHNSVICSLMLKNKKPDEMALKEL